MEKYKAVLSDIEDFGTDVTCFVETRVNWRINKLRNRYKKLLQNKFKKAVMATTTTPQQYKRRYLPGGAVVMTTGDIMSKNIKEHIYDKHNYGRWCGTKYSLGNGNYLNIISAYRVCHQKATTLNSLSTYSQQYFMMKSKGFDNPNPREQFITDIIDQFKEECKSIKNFFLFNIDANEATGETLTGINKFILDCGLVDIYQYKHEDYEEFSTHINGSKRIDFMLCTPNLLDYISKVGYVRYHEGFDSDHRTMFCDISKNIMNISDKIHCDKFRLVGTNSTNAEGETYIRYLYKHLKNNNIFGKIQNLYDNIDTSQDHAEDIMLQINVKSRDKMLL
jgi:hypothetical protein